MIDIRPIPAFDDNYIWMLSRPGYAGCAVVDPGDEGPVIERLRGGADPHGAPAGG